MCRENMSESICNFFDYEMKKTSHRLTHPAHIRIGRLLLFTVKGNTPESTDICEGRSMVVYLEDVLQYLLNKQIIHEPIDNYTLTTALKTQI